MEVVPLPTWKERAVKGMTSNVVQTLQAREFGFPYYSRSTELMSNNFNERMIGRHLINQRNSGPIKSPVVPTVIELIHSKKSTVQKHRERTSQTWFKIKLTKKMNMCYMSGLLQSTKFISRLNANPDNGMYSDCFFKMEPDHYRGFRKFKTPDRRGKIMDSDVGTIRNPVNGQHWTVLLALSERGMITSTKLSSVQKIRKPDFCGLNGLHTNLRFTSFSVDYELERIYALSTDGIHKYLYVLVFPPWNHSHFTLLIRITVPMPMKMEIHSSLVVVTDTSKIEVIPISTILQLSQSSDCNADLTNPATHQCIQICDRELKIRPTPIFTASTVNTFFGVLDSTWPPLYYVKSKSGMNVHRMSDQSSIWSVTIDPYSVFFIEPIPDDSNGFFVTHGRQQCVVSWVKDTTDGTHNYTFTSENPFVMDTPPSENQDVRSRKDRSCKGNPKYREQNTIPVLDVNYFEGLNLLVVCTAETDDTLTVSLYEPRTYKLWKKLPPVGHVRKGLRRSEESNTSSVDEISNVVVKFDFEMIFVKVAFENCSEVFCLRLLEEKYDRI